MVKPRLREILNLLDSSRDGSSVYTTNDLQERILHEIGALKEPEGKWKLHRNERVELALKAVSLGAEVESVVNRMNWKDFEGMVTSILVEHGFKCTESFRRRGNLEIQGMEIDVIGLRGNRIVSIDAKMWGVRKYKSSALKSAAEKQKMRTELLCGLLDRLSAKLDGLERKKFTLSPILVTWLVEDVEFSDGVPIVPVFKLNSFLMSFESYDDLTVRFECER
ncbi:MAG: hypothetical protein JSW61_11555 [Candidatus Thorarchaeota archaeon]|nr:MAG: hypothetical protein JSW61_11555 [Candidatus Thorarchaeota archaeon]